MSISFVLGLALLAFGIGEFVWAMRAKMPRHFVAQGIGFAGLGAMFVAGDILPNETARLVATGLFGASAVFFFGLQVKLTLKWEREGGRWPNSKAG